MSKQKCIQFIDSTFLTKGYKTKKYTKMKGPNKKH